MIKVSRRLETIASFTEGCRVLCDVGCDHAYLDIYLLQKEQIRRAIACDVAEGPASIARQNLMLTGLEEQCEVRLSDGLKAVKKNEADTLVIAGMGGRLTARILSEEADKAASFETLVLSPQSEPEIVRNLLAENGFGIMRETMVPDDGKYYPVIRACPGREGIRPPWEEYAEKALSLSEDQKKESKVNTSAAAMLFRDPAFQKEAEGRFGPCMIARKDPGLYDYLREMLSRSLAVSKTLGETAGSDKAKSRLMEIQSGIGMMQLLLFIFQYL